MEVSDGSYMGTLRLSRSDGSGLFSEENHAFPKNEEYLMKVTSDENGISHGLKFSRSTLADMHSVQMSPGVYTLAIRGQLLSIVSSSSPVLYRGPGETVITETMVYVPVTSNIICHHDTVHKRRYIFSSSSDVSFDHEAKPRFEVNIEPISIGTIKLHIRAFHVDPAVYRGILTCRVSGTADYVTVTFKILSPCQGRYPSQSLQLHVKSEELDISGDTIVAPAGKDLVIICEAWGAPATTADIYFNFDQVTDNLQTLSSNFSGFVSTRWVFKNPPVMNAVLTCQCSDDLTDRQANYTVMFGGEPDVFQFALVSWIKQEVIRIAQFCL